MVGKNCRAGMADRLSGMVDTGADVSCGKIKHWHGQGRSTAVQCFAAFERGNDVESQRYYDMLQVIKGHSILLRSTCMKGRRASS